MVRVAIWKFQSLHGRLPDNVLEANELERIANALISEADVNKQVLATEPRELLESVPFLVLYDRQLSCIALGFYPLLQVTNFPLSVP